VAAVKDELPNRSFSAPWRRFQASTIQPLAALSAPFPGISAATLLDGELGQAEG
jgi:hypothetical protein